MINLLPTDWGIEGVIPRHSKSVLFGLSDSFKSFPAGDMGCSVSTGRSWHGHKVKKCKVIYVANEGANAIGRKTTALGSDSIVLCNGVTIVVSTNSYRSPVIRKS
jgi:AAA domain-containing protein